MEAQTMPDSIREEQLTRLMESYQRELLRMSYVYLHDLSMAEDAVQETFIKVYRNLDTFRGECSIKTWLMRIAMNTCKDMRRAGWFKFVDRRISLEQLPVGSYDSFTEEDHLITTAMMHLPRKQMEVVLLYYYQGMTVYEIAQALRIAAPSVSTRLKRAREQLQKALEGGRCDG